MAVFCKLAVGLQTPHSATSGEKSPKVSGEYLKYSRFWETATGDRVRSTLRGARQSKGSVALYLVAAGDTMTKWMASGGYVSSWGDPRDLRAWCSNDNLD